MAVNMGSASEWCSTGQRKVVNFIGTLEAKARPEASRCLTSYPGLTEVRDSVNCYSGKPQGVGQRHLRGAKTPWTTAPASALAALPPHTSTYILELGWFPWQSLLMLLLKVLGPSVFKSCLCIHLGWGFQPLSPSLKIGHLVISKTSTFLPLFCCWECIPCTPLERTPGSESSSIFSKHHSGCYVENWL